MNLLRAEYLASLQSVKEQLYFPQFAFYPSLNKHSMDTRIPTEIARESGSGSFLDRANERINSGAPFYPVRTTDGISALFKPVRGSPRFSPDVGRPNEISNGTANWLWKNA